MARVKSSLVDQYNQPIFTDVLEEEIARPSVTGVRSPLSGYPGDGLNPFRVASLLREADQGEPLRYFELAEQIEERDWHYAGVLGTRKRSVSQLPITVEPASDDADHERHAEAVREWLKRDELTDELFDILDAVGKGVSFTEIVWDTSEGQWRPKCLEWRDPRWFTFDRTDGATPLLRTDAADDWARTYAASIGWTRSDAVPLPPFKFIKGRIRAKSGLPVRSGLARLATWSWMFKGFTLRDWAVFTQTYGQPIRVGKFDPGASEKDKATLFKAVANIAGDCAAIVPDSMTIEFVKVEGVAGHADLYEKRLDWLDRQVSKAVLGQTATTDAEVGGLGSGKEHRQVQEDIERADCKAIAAILNRDLVTAMIALEFGAQDAYPKLKIGREEERDVKLTVESIERLVPLGMRVAKSWPNQMLGVPEPNDGEDLLTAPAMPAPFAQPRPAAVTKDALQASQPQQSEDAIEALASQAEALMAATNDAMIDNVKQLVNASASLEDIRDTLQALKPDMPEKRLAALMRLALVMARLSGRNEIVEQAQE